ncbi:MAG: hypothetical protein GY875_01385 [Gammaproteobacteria bacterium]|nr:hypothetical protein [Gammaproteobacteria bacterium]
MIPAQVKQKAVVFVIKLVIVIIRFKAIELYEASIAAQPDLIVAKNNLASLLTDQRDDQASHDRAREIAAEFRDSKVSMFRDTYAWASVKSGLYHGEAVVLLKKTSSRKTKPWGFINTISGRRIVKREIPTMREFIFVRPYRLNRSSLRSLSVRRNR